MSVIPLMKDKTLLAPLRNGRHPFDEGKTPLASYEVSVIAPKLKKNSPLLVRFLK
jgi:hypothetical protein